MTALFDNIFGKTTRNVTKAPIIYNNENIGKSVGKSVLNDPVKPQEATKHAGAIKKSFLSNAGMTLQSTPVLQQKKLLNAPTPIFSDADSSNDWFEELEFTRPPYKMNNYHLDIFEDNLKLGVESSHHTPPLKIQDATMEFQPSYEGDFFTDLVMDMNLVLEDDLPEIY